MFLEAGWNPSGLIVLLPAGWRIFYSLFLLVVINIFIGFAWQLSVAVR